MVVIAFVMDLGTEQTVVSQKLNLVVPWIGGNGILHPGPTGRKVYCGDQGEGRMGQASQSGIRSYERSVTSGYLRSRLNAVLHAIETFQLVILVRLVP